MMAAGDAGAGGQGCLIAHYTGLQHACRGRCKLLLASHPLPTSVPRACAVHIISCTLRQVSVINWCCEVDSGRQ